MRCVTCDGVFFRSDLKATSTANAAAAAAALATTGQTLGNGIDQVAGDLATTDAALDDVQTMLGLSRRQTGEDEQSSLPGRRV